MRSFPYAALAIILNALLLSALVVWNVRLRYADFYANQQHLTQASGFAAANQISRLIDDLRHKLEVFTNYQTPLITGATRADPGAQEVLNAMVIEYFQDYLSFTVADATGKIILPNLDHPIGDTCTQDIQSFARDPHTPYIFVHPDPEGYHFDLMQAWRDTTEQKSGIFFISIKLDVLTTLLRNAQLPGQRLLLLKRGEDLLEVDALGSRLQHPVAQYHLSAEEKAGITYTQTITGTLWDLAVIPDPALAQSYLRQLWRDAGRVLVLILTLVALGIARYLQRQLALAQAQLLHSEKLAALGQMVAGVAHEMNTPLAYLRSNLELWISALHSGPDAPTWRDPDNWKEQQDLAEESLSGVDRIAELVRTLRDFSRLDRAAQIPYDLREGLESTLRLTTSLLRNLTVKKQYAANLPLVPCAPSQIHQVLLNLITNAIQAMQGQGTLGIATGATPQEVWVTISDTGPGISPKHLHRLGEPFFTTKAQGEGLGLGLMISYTIIRAHKGHIEVQSKLGQGTKFTLWLPRH